MEGTSPEIADAQAEPLLSRRAYKEHVKKSQGRLAKMTVAFI